MSDILEAEPDYVYCLQCESPVYTFDWDHQEKKLGSAMCPVCGNEESEDFQTEGEFLGEEEG